jgi:glycosyltransferase involved in cell wall biosynthesis
MGEHRRRISIAMATYNGADYLDDQLRSFGRQTRVPDELVVCDDGSSDASLDILREFAATAPFEVHIHQNKTNLGYAANFSEALRRTTGDVVFLSDQDDVWFDHKLETVDAALAARPDRQVAINDAIIADRVLNRTGLTLLGQTRSAGFSDDAFITGCCTAVRRDFLSVLLPVPTPSHTHDGWVHHLALSLGVRLLLPAPLQYYRRHGSNTSAWVTSSTTPARRWHVMRRVFALRNLRSDPRGACAARIAHADAVIDRLEKHEVALKGLVPEHWRMTAALEQARQFRIANLTRSKILEQALPLRVVQGLTFYWRGGYSSFHGWKSLAKDILG